VDYLIDGHNLIAAMPDIELSDPDDELRLVRRLTEWAAAGRKRKVLVVFDGGLVRGKDANLSTPRVQVFFASTAETADSLLVRRIERVRDPGAYTLITSDRAIIATAQARRMPHMFSEAFAVKMDEDLQPGPEPEPDDSPTLSEAEVQAWLDLFGPLPERPPKRKPRRQPAPKPEEPPPPPRPPATPQELKSGEASLTPEEMAEWLDLFGPEPGAPPEKPRPVEEKKRKRRKKPGASAGEEPEGEGRLSREDRAAWLAWLGEDESPD
jgi:predicted RNA-binding protein with PIN domain